jgi:hypothetical protein
MVFNPETIARALMPKEILAEAGSSHLALFLADGVSDVAVFRDGKTIWTEAFQIEHSGNYLEEEIEFCLNRNWHERVFRKVTISTHTKIFTLVPDAFFDEGKLRELLRFHSGKVIAEANHIRVGELGLYLIDEKINSLESFERLWPNIHHFPLAALWLKYSFSKLQIGSDNLMAFHAFNTLYIAAYKQDELQLFNAYFAASPEDVLYYLSSVCMNLHIHMDSCHLGIIADSQTLAILDPYFMHVHELSPEQQAPSSSFHLFVQMLCA